MRKREFTRAEIKALRYERFYPPPHPRVQRKMEAVYLKSLQALPASIKQAISECLESALVKHK
jgi:hypothetical protein